MRSKTFRLFKVAAALLLSVVHGVQATSEVNPGESTQPPGQLFHVSPAGSDAEGDGTASAPLGTLAHALKRVNSQQPATIRLLPGVYREQITIGPPKGDDFSNLTIEGSNDGEVIFEGGVPVTTWQAIEGQPAGVFRLVDAVGQVARSGEGEYFEVWDARERTRYRKQADLAGVAAYPASVAVEGTNLLIHTSDGKEPKDLWRAQQAFAFSIRRPKVTLRNIVFRDYSGGGWAHAVGIDRKAHDTVIEKVRFENSTCAIINDGLRTRVSEVQMKEVGRGVENRGDEITVEDCVIESATGRFTFSDNNQHKRNGIRIYYPARGGLVRRNVTVGFWAGFYIKTASSAKDALPILAEQNTFLDGINFGGNQQPKTAFRRNLIGPDESGDGLRRLPKIGATFESNYFFSPEFQKVAEFNPGNNFTGPLPFGDLSNGNLATTEPRIAEYQIGVPARDYQWTPGIRSLLARQTNATKVPAPGILSPLEVVASRHGALLLATLSAPASEVVVKVRRQGDKEWMQVVGQVNGVDLLSGGGTPAPVEPSGRTYETSYLFDVTGGQLVSGQGYEAVLVIPRKGEKEIVTDPVVFRTTGDPKVIHVAAKAPAENADGTPQHPWPHLQQALDRALPGDVVELGEGVYTRPAILRHGGTAEHPIQIKGQSKNTTFVDGGKEFSTLLKLENAPHVSIFDLTFRWFGDCGIMAFDSQSVRVERCHFQNALSRRGANGRAGLYLLRSPNAKVHYNTFTTAENGARMEESPGFIFKNNTAFGNLYSGLQIIDSSRNSIVTHNALTFTGNHSLDILERNRQAWESISCDFNNYGNRLNNGNAPERPENDFRPPERYGKVSGKGIIRCRIAPSEESEEGRPGEVFYSMKSWHGFSGKDANSIFADPDYIDPLNNNFHVEPKSCHLLGGGAQIGAEGRLPSSAAAVTP